MGKTIVKQDPRERVLSLLRSTREDLETSEDSDTLKALIQNSDQFLDHARQLKIRSKRAYDDALAMEKDIKHVRTNLAGEFKEPKALGRAIWQFFVKREKSIDGALAEAERLLKGKRTKWFSDEQQRIEKQRLKKAAEARRKAEAARDKEVEDLRNSGADEAADELAEMDVEVPKVEIQAHANRAGSGASFAKKWYAEVVDKEKVPEQYKVVDMSSLNKLAQANEGQDPPEGVRFVFKYEPRTRA